MAGNTFTIPIDIKLRQTSIVPRFVQYDSGILRFLITDNGQPLNITGLTKQEITLRRVKDNVVFVENMTIENEGTKTFFSYKFKGSEMNQVGVMEVAVSVYFTEDKITTLPFKIEIVDDLQNGAIEDAVQEVSALRRLINEVDQLVVDVNTEVDTLVTNVNTNINNLNDAMNLAEDIRVQNEDERITEHSQRLVEMDSAINSTKLIWKGVLPNDTSLSGITGMLNGWVYRIEVSASNQNKSRTVRYDGNQWVTTDLQDPTAINTLTAQLDDKASKQDVNDRVAQIVSGSPKDTYSSLSALEAAKPTGDTGVYLTTDNGHWYWWNGSVWVDGGVYQAADLPISEKSITRNLFDKDAVIEGKQVLAGGNIVNYANSAITPYIDVEGLPTLYFSGLPTYIATVGNRYGKFYDANNSPLGADVLIPTSATTGTVSVPSGAKYFVLSIYQLKTSSEVVDYGIIQIESGGIQTPYVAYQAGVYEIEGKKIIGSNPVKVPLKTKGKSLLLFGDSITHTATVSDDGASYTEGALTNWPTYSKVTLEVGQMWNYAFGGAAYRDRDGVLFKQKISNQITAAINNNRPGDIIVVAAGTNDQGINMGSYATAMSKTTRESLDRTLFYEAVRWAFWTIRLNYPNAICFASTPVQRAAYEPIPALSNAIKEMARRYNFIVIDAEFESGIVRDFEVANGAGRYLTDGLHPNYDGKILLSKLFNREILNAVNNAYESL